MHNYLALSLLFLVSCSFDTSSALYELRDSIEGKHFLFSCTYYNQLLSCSEKKFYTSKSFRVDYYGSGSEEFIKQGKAKCEEIPKLLYCEQIAYSPAPAQFSLSNNYDHDIIAGCAYQIKRGSNKVNWYYETSTTNNTYEKIQTDCESDPERMFVSAQDQDIIEEIVK